MVSRERAKLDVGDVFKLPVSHRREGVSPTQTRPRDLGAATFGGKTITSQKELRGFPFDVVRGYCMLPCGRMLRARWSVCACAYVSLFACAAMHVMWRGDSSQRAAGADVWLPLTVRSRRGWSAEGPTLGPPFPRDKSLHRFDRCEFYGFCAQSLEPCRVRNLTFAESQGAFSDPSRRFWSESEWKRRVAVLGCTGGRVGGAAWGALSCTCEFWHNKLTQSAYSGAQWSEAEPG